MRVGLAIILLCFTESASAAGSRLIDVLADGHAPSLQRALFGSEGRFIAAVASPEDARAQGLVPVTASLAVGRGGAGEARNLIDQKILLSLGPPRRPLLDVAETHQNASVARADYGLDGSGVYVGLVDTGVSLTHPDLRRSDGSTRIAWLMTFDEGPRGLQPELEAEYDCEANQCAILSASDIDTLLSSGTPDPRLIDTYGHGTHVASTMAGADPKYPGVAPNAELIVVQAGGGTGSIADGEILLGAKFAFDRANQVGRPLALNLSLGSSFGPHDGSTSLEMGLAELASGPGRAIIVASGNAGSVYSLAGSQLPEPLGVHAEATVRPGATTHLTLATAYSGSGDLSVFGYVSIQPGDDVQIAFRGGNGAVTDFAPHQGTIVTTSARLGDAGEYEVALINGHDQALMDLGEDSLAFFWTGRVQGGGDQEILFRGKGNVRVWVESILVSNGSSTPGAVLLPRGRTSGTVAIPASHPDLLTVGASVNRASWTDYEGNRIVVDEVVDGVASFSSAGPNQLGQIKPDLLAPGSNLVAAMAAEADPRIPGRSSQFSSGGYCPADAADECFVVDDAHGVSSGTSMAAPQVTGTVALLLQRDPSLTMAEIRDLLRGGARAPKDEGFPSNWYGAGSLDVVGSLLAQDAFAEGAASGEPNPGNSRLAFANTFLYPNADLSLEMIVLPRDSRGRPVGIDSNDYQILIDEGTAEIVRTSPGVLTALLRAPRGSGGRTARVRVLHREREILSSELPIGVDPTTAILGYDVQGGCSTHPRVPRSAPWPWVGGLFAVVLLGLSRRGRFLWAGRSRSRLRASESRNS